MMEARPAASRLDRPLGSCSAGPCDHTGKGFPDYDASELRARRQSVVKVAPELQLSSVRRTLLVMGGLPVQRFQRAFATAPTVATTPPARVATK